MKKSEYDKQLRQHRKDNNLCVRCGKDNDRTLLTCSNCYNKSKPYKKLYRELNINKVKLYEKEYWKNNKERLSLKKKDWNTKNKDKLKILNKKHNIKRLTTLKGREQKRNGSRRYKSKKRGIIELFTNTEWTEKKESCNGICPGCNYCVGFEKLTLDHIYPISLAEEGRIYTIDDVQPFCGSCNSSKSDGIGCA